ncbi:MULTISPECIES: oxidoreductase [Streptomyces]|uniref:Oxidoreductase n=1 Tax=Streptomyces solicathayae TaxID=3081768 RepID=A0ABZ0LNG5_9ACTN|nr:oxidoreductase [Streptomyces sp. HUAS YS2]WOX21009.1 oxidoreductase [Streptomyces sp. HUAS YS2]
MAAEYATFALAPAVRAGGVLVRGAQKLHREFLDFVVDGRPLLQELSELDAVSPLAADVPPEIFGEDVRRLLLEAEPPLAGGRCVLYACPECAGLDCGAVTAVVERDGDAVVWRDFAWQTDEDVDLERDGYHGIGPFRFRADEYRAALAPLLAAGRPARPRVLLVGARATGLGRLAAALRSIGIGADIAQDAEGVTAEELRGYGAVAFGPEVGEPVRGAVRQAFARAGAADVAYVDGLAPVIPLLVAQIEHALDRTPTELRRVTRLEASSGEAVLEVTAPCRVTLLAYRTGLLNRTRVHLLHDEILAPGTHRIPLTPHPLKGRSYILARTTSNVPVPPVTYDPPR